MRFECKMCQEQFRDRPSRTRQYCSITCYRKNRKGKNIKPLNKIACQECDKSFIARRWQVEHRGKKYCSKKCLFRNASFRKKRSLSTPKGAMSHLWRGGVSSNNQKIRKSSDYEIWRLCVFERDNFTCQTCNERGVYLEADHIKPFSLFPELRFAVSNGQTLCRACHILKTKKDMVYIRKEQYRAVFV